MSEDSRSSELLGWYLRREIAGRLASDMIGHPNGEASFFAEAETPELKDLHDLARARIASVFDDLIPGLGAEIEIYRRRD